MGNKNGLTGLPTGFEDLDNLTSGLHGSDFIILAARPSMGKTAFALNVVQNVAIRAAKKVGELRKQLLFQPGNEQGAACTAYALRRSQH